MQVTKVEMEGGDYRFKLRAVPRKSGSMSPRLISITDLKSNVKSNVRVSKKKIDGELKREAFASAAVIFNKFGKLKKFNQSKNRPTR